MLHKHTVKGRIRHGHHDAVKLCRLRQPPRYPVDNGHIAQTKQRFHGEPRGAEAGLNNGYNLAGLAHGCSFVEQVTLAAVLRERHLPPPAVRLRLLAGYSA